MWFKKRFSARYDKWKTMQDKAQTMEGTILAELPWMTKSQIAELNYMNIFTVEQLAELDDARAMKFMHSYQLRDRAKNFLAAAAGEAPMLKLQAELEKRDNEIQVLQRQMQEMTAAFEKLSAGKGKG